MEIGGRLASMNKEKIRVGRVTFEFYPIIGGSVIHISELSRRINPHVDYQILIAPDFLGEYIDKFPFEVVRLPYSVRIASKKLRIPLLSFILYTIALAFKLISLSKRKKINIIHNHNIHTLPICIIVSKLLKIPVVHMSHGSNEGVSKFYGLIESIIARMFHPDHAIILDDGGLGPEKFCAIWRQRCTIVYHGIEEIPVNDISTNKKTVGRAEFRVGIIGNLGKVKRADLGIKMFYKFNKMLRQRISKLLIIGDGEERLYLERLTQRFGVSDRVIFLGKLPNSEVKSYLRGIDVILGTSTYSNMNRSIQEAMIAKKPVIVFRTPRIEKLINDRNGIIIHDTDEGAEMLVTLFLNPKLRKRYGHLARSSVVKSRSWERRVKKELNIYKTLIKRGRR